MASTYEVCELFEGCDGLDSHDYEVRKSKYLMMRSEVEEPKLLYADPSGERDDA